jgi:DNA-binding CsgD family transcriptional regulator
MTEYGIIFINSIFVPTFVGHQNADIKMGKDQADISTVYFQLLQATKLDVSDSDYTLVRKVLDNLQTLSKIGSSGISVFDFNHRKHIFYSSNYGQLLGYSISEIEANGQEFIDQKIHPADKTQLIQVGISALKLFCNFSQDEKMNYKLINEFRVANNQNEYIRVIEQHQILELDKRGNVWLSISFIDLSPDQEEYEGVKTQLLNFKTGKIIPLNQNQIPIQIELTKRELEILKLVKDGFLSKEISDKLAISVHTVNTHRQRLLEKLGANNSIEAIVFASKLGLLS